MGTEVGTSGIVLVCLLVIARFVGGGHGGFAAFFNAGVHTVNGIKNVTRHFGFLQVMYLYYFLSAFGPKMQPFLWWKRWDTDVDHCIYLLFEYHLVVVDS